MTAEFVSVDEALALLAENPLARSTERLAIARCGGRRLAETIMAPFDRPAHALSAMDGYAVRLADVAKPGAKLTVIGEARAGHPFSGSVGPGETVRLFTGSRIPPDADHVVMQEEVERSADRARIGNGYSQPAFVRAAGIDFTAGTELLSPGVRLSPAMIALAASANRAELDVEARPRIGIMANGDELVAPGTEVRSGQAIDANRPGLLAMAEAMGGDPVDCGILADDPAAIEAAITADVDVFVPVGGASVGDHDYMRGAFQRAGFEMVFDKVAIRPGKPCWFGRRGKQRVLGLPGNPASALVCARLFLGPLLGRDWTEHTARLETPLAANGRREHFMRAAVWRDPDGSLRASVAPSQDSSLLTPLVEYDGLVRRHAYAEACQAGSTVAALVPDGLACADGEKDSLAPRDAPISIT